jgi:type IX secretion system PorP/SprF family membrane protein
MKAILNIAILTILFGPDLRGQYIPNSTQAYQYASVYNPAFTGVEPFASLKLGYRIQWIGVGANAPQFIDAVFDTRLNQPPDLARNALRTSASRNVRVPFHRRIIHGFGSNLFGEELGIVDRVGGGLNYAAHCPVSRGESVRIAVGTSLRLENTRVDVNKIYLGRSPDPDPYYEFLIQDGINETALNVRVGALIYSPSFYFGGSYLPLGNVTLSSSSAESSDDTFYKGTVQAGISFPIGSDLDIKPSAQGVWLAQDELLFDYNVKLIIRRKVWLGVTYRDVESVVGLVGFDINNFLVATYTYEVPTSAVHQFTNASHEFVLALRFNHGVHHRPNIW